MGHNNRIGYGSGSDSGTRFGIEIFSEGYKSAIRIYQNGKDVSDLYRDEIQYVNQRIAMVVSRYREMYRYQIMMSSTYGGGWRVEFDTNQIQDMGFKGTNSGVDRVYSDLDSLSIQFSEELNGVLDNVVKAYEFSRECNDVCGVKSQYVGNEDKRYWEELLDTVVKYTTDVLERFYVYYVGLLTNRDVIEYMLHRYDRGLVIGRYHNELANSILHMRIDISLYQIQDVEVDIAHTYWIDVGDEYVGGYRVIWDSIMKNAYYLPLVTKGSAKGLCDVLEMMAYSNDALIQYLKSSYESLGREVSGSLYMPYRKGVHDITDRFSDFVERGLLRISLNCVTDGVCVCSIDDFFNDSWQFRFSLPVGLLSRKLMASRVSCGVLWFDMYINMLHLYAKKVFGVDIDR